jgi:RNA polymerase sigma-70 factor (ECF subfamily)
MPRSAADVTKQDFAFVIRPLIEPAFRLAFAMLHDRHAAEDAVQEAAFTAWRKLPSLRDRERLRPWFMKVVANICRNTRRRKWTSGVTIGVPETLSVASGEDHVVRGLDLRRAISRLRDEDQVLIHLFFYLDMPLEEVAATVGGSVPATRARLYRSIKKIRPDLDPEEALK